MTEETPTDPAVTVAEEVVGVLGECRMSEERIIDGALEAPDSITDPVTAVAHQCEVLYGGGNGVDVGGQVKTGVLQSVLAGSGRGIVLDNTYHHKKNLEFQLDRALGKFGYGFELRSVGANGWVEPSDDCHPRAFELVVTDDDTDVATNGFRYPPYDGFGHVTNDFRSLGTALNETVLREVGVQIRMLDERSGSQQWVLFESDTLETLESKYGPHLKAFGERLVRRGPSFQYGWDGIDLALARDHEEAYGVPEPEDTFKIEAAFDVVESADDADEAIESGSASQEAEQSDGSPDPTDMALLDRVRRWFL